MKTKLSVFITDPIKSLNMQTDLRAVSIHVLTYNHNFVKSFQICKFIEMILPPKI